MHIQFFLVLWKGVWCPCLQRRHDYHYGGISEAETYNCKTQGILLEDQWCGLNKNYPTKTHVEHMVISWCPCLGRQGLTGTGVLLGQVLRLKVWPHFLLFALFPNCQSGLVLHCCAFAAMVDCIPSEPWAKFNAFSSFYWGLNQDNRKATGIICILLCP